MNTSLFEMECLKCSFNRFFKLCWCTLAILNGMLPLCAFGFDMIPIIGFPEVSLPQRGTAVLARNLMSTTELLPIINVSMLHHNLKMKSNSTIYSWSNVDYIENAKLHKIKPIWIFCAFSFIEVWLASEILFHPKNYDFFV